jgi:DNA-binding NarL/FixJ family response regulator
VTQERIRVALADDDVLLREGLASLLERSGFDVVGQCGDAARLLALVREGRPDLVIVDIRMPPGHSTEGLDAAHQIRAEFPGTAILVLSAHAEVEHAMDLLASGERSGYLLKSRVINVDDFTETLRRLVRGGSVVDPVLVAELVAARRVDDPLLHRGRLAAPVGPGGCLSNRPEHRGRVWQAGAGAHITDSARPRVVLASTPGIPANRYSS